MIPPPGGPWERADVAAFDRPSLDALLDGRVPAVRIAQFATPDECVRLADELCRGAVRTRTVPEVTRLGISQYEQGLRGSKRAYFALARRLRPRFARIFGASFDPVARLLDHLSAAGYDADVAVEPGWGRYWAGNGKLRTGPTPLHVDFSPQDSTGWQVGTVDAQLAWNLYISDPGGVGDLWVHDRQWTEADDVHQIAGSYAYDPVVVSGTRRLEIPTVVGDVVLVNARCYHAVAPSRGRLAFGSFAGRFADGRIALWS